MIKSDAELLVRIINCALNGEIFYDDLVDQCKKINFNDDVVNTIYEDLEEAVQHTPGYFFSKKTDLEVWGKQYEHSVLLMDLHLMPYVSDMALWSKLRMEILCELRELYNRRVTQKIISEAIMCKLMITHQRNRSGEGNDGT